MAEAPPSPAPIRREWIEEIERAPRMEAVGSLLVEFCEESSCRAMLFLDYFGTPLLWRGSGPPDASAALAARVDLSGPSIFSTAARTGTETVFSSPGTESDQKFFAAFAEAPTGAVVVPICAPRQPRLLLYADAGRRALTPVERARLLAVCGAAARAYARITTTSD